MAHSVYLYALASTLCFSFSTLIFTEFANRTSAVWVNFYKAFIAVLGCVITVSLFQRWHHITFFSLALLLASGFAGLNIADFFMVRAFQHIGPARTLLLYGFQPLLVGVASFYLFHQEIHPNKLIAIIFLLGCLITFSYERFKQSGRWEIKGFLLALTFVVLDSFGLILTRLAFDNSPDIGAIEAHGYRSFGAVLGFWIMMSFKPLNFLKIFKKMTKKSRLAITVGAFFGTFVSLAFYFRAVQTGHLASVTSVAITTPFFASIFESIYHKKRPSLYLILAFIQFSIGFWILITY